MTTPDGHYVTNPNRHKPSRALPWIIGAALVGLLLCAGLFASVLGGGSNDNASPLRPITATTYNPPATKTAAPAVAVTPKVSDFSLDLKITSKQCFGSAGCNLQWKVGLNLVGSVELRDSDTWSITYEVRGVEDGPQIETLTVTGDQVESWPGFGSTRTKSTKVTAAITRVEKVGL